VAAGDPTWLDLAADRASRVGLVSVGVPTDLQLDYLGWAQVMAAVVRQLEATTILVDEASRPERFPEVAAIAELLDAAQLTCRRLAPTVRWYASRVAGSELQTCRVRARGAGSDRRPPIDEYPTPRLASMRRFGSIARARSVVWVTVRYHRGRAAARNGRADCRAPRGARRQRGRAGDRDGAGTHAGVLDVSPRARDRTTPPRRDRDRRAARSRDRGAHLGRTGRQR
jgi:hypothetical protein